MSENIIRRSVTSFFSNPIVGAVGSIASIIGIPLAFYLSSKEIPQLTYYVNPTKAVVVKSGQASRLTASFDNSVIETDITASQIAIWNQGNKAIKKDNILKPIVIYTENETPILEATLRKSSRDVIGLALNTNELQKGRLNLSWDILEHNDGGVIQLIYAGNTNIKIESDGIIEEQGQIKKLASTKITNSDENKSVSQNQSYSSVWKWSFAICALLILIYVYNKINDRKRENQRLQHQEKLKNLNGEELEEYIKTIEQSNSKLIKQINVMDKIVTYVGFGAC